MPNSSKYYLVAQLPQFPKYHASKEIPLWVALESVDCDLLSLANLLWLDPPHRRSLTNLITLHLLAIWDRHKTHFGLQSPHKPRLSFLHNPAFYPAWTSPAGFSAWASAGLFWAHKFFTSTSILSFPSLRKSYNIPSSELFHYLQIKHFLTPLTLSDPFASHQSFFEHVCKSDPHRKGLISDLYRQLL